MPKICSWVNLKNPLYIEYHNKEWGKPVFDDKKLFEMLVLEGAQAGLSWETILSKRENYREIFFDYNLSKIIQIDEKYFEKTLQNPGIIRNKAKIKSVIQNAKIFLQIQEEFGSFSKYIWSFTNGKIIQNRVENYKNLPKKTELSEKISKDLKKRGMNFVGPTIIYAYLQAIGVVNDHENDCFCKMKKICDECESEYFSETSKMENLCPNCAFLLYGYENCQHFFENEKCIYCGWNGKISEFCSRKIVQKNEI